MPKITGRGRTDMTATRAVIEHSVSASVALDIVATPAIEAGFTVADPTRIIARVAEPFLLAYLHVGVI